MARQTGRVTVSVDGEKLQSKAGASCDIGGEDYSEDGITDQGTYYAKEMLVPGEIKCTLIHMADTDLSALRGRMDLTVQFEADTGRVGTMANANAKVGTLTNGECEVTFRGSPVKGL